MTVTPMMQQYLDAKAAAGDAILLFRMGDFYELFSEDAKTAARELGLTLTSRDKGENAIPMAGFPHHQLDSYLGKLIRAGFRAAVCEQVEDPRKAKGLVKREITRVVSPGTLTDDALLDPRSNNYLASVVGGGGDPGDVGLAWAELSTGRFYATVVPRGQLADHVARIEPAECLVPDDLSSVPPVLQQQTMLTTRPAWSFSIQPATESLSRQFQTTGLDGFGFESSDALAIRAAGAILDYLAETQKSSLDHFDRLLPYRAGTALEIDEATRRSLEMTRTIRDGRREGSLLAVIDRTVTAMGSRMLGQWLAAPLTDVTAIDRRLEAVGELVGLPDLRRTLHTELRGVYDLERLLARVTTGRAGPRDLSFIGKTLESLPNLKQPLASSKASLLVELNSQVDLCPEVRERLNEALTHPCPLMARDGNFIRPGFHAELDELRRMASGGKKWIASYQAEESERSGIANLKVGFNKVFGYYIEVTNAHRDRVPPTYIRKQTLKNAERFITPELKEYEERVLSADERSQDLEIELFTQLRQEVQTVAQRLQRTAAALAQLDVLVALAELAHHQDYCRPALVEEAVLEIVEGRHPVLDVLEPQGTFVPNDSVIDPDHGMMLLITGPNMAGKSTYIRQVALISILAQMGSFVPARHATIGVADRIFARVGASDELSKGQSTFMVEMTETARILNTATRRSLVILDEIGRGTSTYDGVSLAWAIVEYLHDRIGCRTMFATHYHELTDLERSLSSVTNLNVAVKEWDEQVVFLHKIVSGAADKSYGIHVARLAGVPREVNERAKQVLAQLEADHLDETGEPRVRHGDPPKKPRDLQLTLFAPYDHPLLDVIRSTDVNALTPIEALQRIQQWQQQLDDAHQPKPR